MLRYYSPLARVGHSIRARKRGFGAREARFQFALLDDELANDVGQIRHRGVGQRCSLVRRRPSSSPVAKTRETRENSGIGTYPASASTLAARGATKDGGARGDAEVEAGRGDAGGECVILFARLLRVLSSSSPSSSPSAAARAAIIARFSRKIARSSSTCRRMRSFSSLSVSPPPRAFSSRVRAAPPPVYPARRRTRSRRRASSSAVLPVRRLAAVSPPPRVPLARLPRRLPRPSSRHLRHLRVQRASIPHHLRPFPRAFLLRAPRAVVANDEARERRRRARRPRVVPPRRARASRRARARRHPRRRRPRVRAFARSRVLASSRPRASSRRSNRFFV